MLVGVGGDVVEVGNAVAVGDGVEVGNAVALGDEIGVGVLVAVELRHELGVGTAVCVGGITVGDACVQADRLIVTASRMMLAVFGHNLHCRFMASDPVILTPPDLPISTRITLPTSAPA